VEDQISNFELLSRATRSDSPANALVLCDQILADDSRHLPALELKIKCQWRLGQYEAALDGLGKALALNPYDPGYHFLKGDCYQNLLCYGEALDCFERCRQGDDPELAAQAEVRLKGLEEWQSGLMGELLRSQPQLAARFRKDPGEIQKYGFRPADAQMTESVLARLASPSMWARPS